MLNLSDLFEDFEALADFLMLSQEEQLKQYPELFICRLPETPCEEPFSPDRKAENE